MRRHGAAPNLFARWHRWIGDEIEVCALRAPGRESRSDERAFTDVREALDSLLPEIAELVQRPYVLFGYSLGGLVMYSLAQRLRSMQAPAPLRLIVAATSAPHCRTRVHGGLPSDEALLEFLRGSGLDAGNLLEDEAFRRSVLDRTRADIAMFNGHEAYALDPPLACPISAFASREDSIAPFESIGSWAELTTSDFALRTMPGGHFFIHTHEAQLQSAIRAEIRQILTSLGMGHEQPMGGPADEPRRMLS